MLNGVEPQEIEVVAKARRRTFTAEYKRKIVREADACAKHTGELGALLRREGLYSSHLSKWREEVAERELSALAPKRRGPKPNETNAADKEMAALRREISKLTVRAERAELIIDIQKKVASILGVELPKIDEKL